jgi:hypothetical protein
MERVHDMGGRTRFFGPLPPIDPDEPVFHEAWEGRVFALAPEANRVAGANVHAFRYAVERVPEMEYLSGYYRRWLAAAEILLLDSGILAPGAVEARARRLGGTDVAEPPAPEPHKPTMASGGQGNLRTVDAPAAFAVGDTVITRPDEPAPHTRLPSYARGKRGTVVALRPAQSWRCARHRSSLTRPRSSAARTPSTSMRSASTPASSGAPTPSRAA